MQINDLFTTDDFAALARIIRGLNLALNRLYKRHKALDKAYDAALKKIDELKKKNGD
jgi:hypothetical protein